MAAVVSPVQALNAPRPSFVALSGRVTSLSFSQPQNASASICARHAGRSTLLRAEQWANASRPMRVTPAEIRAFAAWGADTVAMSVCEEVIAARHVGIRVLGMSLCSNMACGVEGASPSDEEVFEVAKRREPDFCRLVTEIVRAL